jgi:hypothetical protein
MLKKHGSLAVLAVLVLAPLPFGAAEPFWGAMWCAIMAAALLFAAPTLGNAKLRTTLNVSYLVIAIWCAIVFVQFTSTGDFMPTGPGWDQAGRIINVVPKAAAYRDIPIGAVVPPLALALALNTGLVFGSETGFTPRAYSCAALAGLAYAGYGVFAELTNPTMLLWREKTAYLNSVTGTFVNHNTAATFFGSIALIWYLRSLREFRRWFDLTRWQDLKYTAKKLKDLQSNQIGYLIAFLILLATTLMTRSRAGSLLTMAVLGLTTILYFSHEIVSFRRLWTAVCVFMALCIFVILIVGGQFASELETRGVYDSGRVEAWLAATRIIHDHPWLGTGLGTFGSVFSGYRLPAGGVWGVWDHAHSTPLELAVEMGLPFSLLVFSVWLLMLQYLLKMSVFRFEDRYYLVNGAVICVLGTLHSLVDFSLQIPGFSIIFGILVGASLARGLVTQGNERSKPRPGTMIAQ